MKKILICTLICLFSVSAFAEDFTRPILRGAPLAVQKLYIWPAFDCNVVPEVYVLRDAMGVTAVKKDGGQIKIFGRYPSSSALEAELSGSVKLACPVRLPAGSRISNVWVKGDYYPMAGAPQVYLGIQMHDLEGAEGPFMENVMSSLFSIRFSQGFDIEGPEVPTYMLIETYSKFGASDRKYLFNGGYVDINLVEVEYVAP